ncbi:MAG: hypothetical protein JEY96_07415 [Bacteroidales bacterium]|nr:hypothetical protein [Bacteroidales bacterium]
MNRRMIFSKYIKILISIIIIFFTNPHQIFSNNIEIIEKGEDSLKHYFSQIIAEKTDLKKELINSKILTEFRAILKVEESFNYKFDSLKNIGVLNSSDKKLRIITWNIPYSDGTHKYFGFIQFRKTKNQILTFELNDNSLKIKNPETQILNHENWYGALYYKIIENKNKGKTYYTLLGADLNNLFTHKKIIEVLYFGKKDSPVFGDSVFKNQKSAITRVIFEFNAQSNMTLTYDENMQMIVYDHLSPSRPSLKDQFEFYGPDFSYDGLKFERGIWNRYQEIDVRNYMLE